MQPTALLSTLARLAACMVLPAVAAAMASPTLTATPSAMPIDTATNTAPDATTRQARTAFMQRCVRNVTASACNAPAAARLPQTR